MVKTRIDKWLWAVRIYKSRSQATEACRSGKIKIGDRAVKASQEITPGNIVKIRKGGFNLQYRIIQLIDKRVSASLAAPCYENLTPIEELNKYNDWFIGKASAERRSKGMGRPTKRERRELDEFKNES